MGAWIIVGLTAVAYAYSLYKASKIGAPKLATQRFDGPTAEEGIAIPVVFGTATVKNPNTTAFLNRLVQDWKDNGTNIKLYSASMQMGICHGKVDALLDVLIGGKSALLKNDPTPDSNVLNIGATDHQGDSHNTPNFGGDFKLGLANLTTVDTGTADFLAEKLGMPSGIGPHYSGVCTAMLKTAWFAQSPTAAPLAFTVKRIHTRHGGTAEQWYDAKAEILPSIRSREDLWKYKLVTNADTTDYSGTGVDDSDWSQGKGGLSNGSQFWKPSEELSDYTTVPRVLTCVAGTTLGGQLIGGHPNYSVPEGMKIWVRWTMGPMPKFPTVAQLWHDDSAKLWVNGNAVTLTPANIDLTKEHFTSTAIIPAAYLDDAGPNVIAYCVQDSYAADGVTKIGTRDLIYAGIQIGAAVGSEPPAGVGNMNPAHMIREALTDRIWGMGYGDADIDAASFTAAADTLYAEGLGLSVVWSQQMSIEDFIDDIKRHISAVLYIDPTTGLFTLKLIREDYAIEDLPILDESNIVEIEEATRKQPGELINCVTVTYTASLRGDQGSTDPQYDDGLVEIQGGVVSTQIDYPAITSPVNAAKLALRDLRMLSAPLLTARVVADRSAADFYPGKPFILRWPDLGFLDFVMRVDELDTGDGIDNKVKITCVEDVFFLPSQAIVMPNDPVGLSPIAAPTPTVATDEFRTALTIDVRNRGMVETAFHDAAWGNGGLCGTFTESEPGVLVRNFTGPLTAGMFDDIDPFTGVSGGAGYTSGEQWMIGRTVFAFALAGDVSGGKKFQGAWIVDDIGGHYEGAVFVSTYARMHRATSFNASADFIKDMVLQVRNGTAYGGHFLQLNTAGVVLGTTEQAWSDEGADFTFTDTYDLLRDDQFAGRQVSPDSFLVVSKTGRIADLQGFATLALNASRIPAGRWSATPQGCTLSGGDAGATTTLGFKLFRAGAVPAALFELQTAALLDGFNPLGQPLRYEAPAYPMTPADRLVLIPTLHTTSTTPVTVSLLFSAANAITLQMPKAVTNSIFPPTEDWFDVTIVDGVISDFSDHRHLRVHGAGPLVGIDTTTSTGGTHLSLSFVEDVTITAAGTPTSGAQIKTKKLGSVYQNADAAADAIVGVALMTDSGSLKFWQLIGG
jgi:hypothetical protein